MSSRPILSAKPASTTAAITAAASDIFLREGFEAASMDAIARHADVSKATLYAHFSSKEILFAGVMQAQREAYGCQLDALLGENDGDFAARLTRVGMSLLTFMLSPNKLRMFRVFIAENERIPDICRTFVQAGREHAYQRVAAVFREGISSGQLEEHDAAEAARLFVCALRGDLVWSCLLSGAQSPPSQSEIEARVAAVVQPLVRLYAKHDMDKRSGEH